MARLRVVESDLTATSSGVPAELKDWDNSYWFEPVLFRQWVVANLRQQPSGQLMDSMCDSPDYGARYRFARDAWALENGFVNPRWPAMADLTGLEQVGIPRMTARERSRTRLAANRRTG